MVSKILYLIIQVVIFKNKIQWKLLNSFHIPSITLWYDSFPSELINLMHTSRELETLFKVIIISKYHKEKSYVIEAFQKYLIFVFIEDNEFKINFKNKILLVVPKSLRNEIISLSHYEWYSRQFKIFQTIL